MLKECIQVSQECTPTFAFILFITSFKKRYLKITSNEQNKF